MSNNTLFLLPENDDAFIRRTDLPKYLPVAAQTLARWASEGSGPPYVKLGKRLVAYRVGDLKAWLAQQQRSNYTGINNS